MAERRRWPDGAEQRRQDALAAIDDVRKLLRDMRENARKDPDFVIMMTYEAGEILADAARFLAMARSGEKDQ